MYVFLGGGVGSMGIIRLLKPNPEFFILLTAGVSTKAKATHPVFRY